MKLKFFLAVVAVIICSKVAGQGKYDKEEMLNSEFPVIGAYLWCDFGQFRNEAFFDFAKMNGVTEIYLAQRLVDYYKKDNSNNYYYDSSYYFEKTKYFLEMAHKRGFKVFRLLGSQRETIKYFKLDIIDIGEKIQQTIDYNKKVPDSLKFAGIHLDIEFSKIKDDPNYQRYQIFADSAVRLCEQYGKQIKIDFSIIQYHTPVKYKKDSTALYKVIIDIADRTFVQSYNYNKYPKYNADTIFKIVEPLIEYAEPKNKTIIYTIRPEEFPDGYIKMNEQLKRLYDITKYKNTGLAIHTLSNWFSKADIER